MARLNRHGAGLLCRFILDSGQLAEFCDQVERLPSYLLPLIMAGLYRPAPRCSPLEHGGPSIRAAFADLLKADLPLVLVRLRCTQRVRLILEEYATEAGPICDILSVTVRWLDPDRFDHGTQGEFWSLARCFRPASMQPVHWRAVWRRR